MRLGKRSQTKTHVFVKNAKEGSQICEYLRIFKDAQEYLRISKNIENIDVLDSIVFNLIKLSEGQKISSEDVESYLQGFNIKQENKNNVKVINNSNVDTTIHLSANESYNLITGNSIIKDEIASHIYYKDIGSRKGLTVAESDVEYVGATDTVKTVYRSKAVTNIRKLVTEGYIKIERTTGDVSIAVEKINL